MTLLTVTLAAFTAAADLSAAEAEVPRAPLEARAAIQQSLAFLEKDGVGWWKGKKCAGCHHVSMMVWTHYEARKHGFAVNDAALQEQQQYAIDHYLSNPDFAPTGQDKGFPEKGPGPGAVYLALGLRAAETPEPAAAEMLAKLSAHFASKQSDNGSWPTKTNQAPLVDGHEGLTLMTLLALDPKDPSPAVQESRKKALNWLKETPSRDENQLVAYRLLAAVAAVAAEDASEVQKRVEQLRAAQSSDGGWSQVKDRRPDALATGQALYALAAAGVSPDDDAVVRARSWLTRTQRDDGSWLVKTRGKSNDVVISYYGTGWAALGLMKTLPSN